MYVSHNKDSLFFICNSESNQVVEIDDDIRANFSISPTTVATNCNSDTITEMKSISMEEYRKLCQGTIDLIKANQTISKLNLSIQKKNAIIENLEIQLKTRAEGAIHLSTVTHTSNSCKIQDEIY